MRRHSAFTIPYSLFRIRRSRAAFTLIELMVAIGLMALMMSMIATIFHQATQSFSIARAGVEVHQNARAAYGMMVNDFAAAKLCEYEDKAGYFALSWERSGASGEPATPAITFTTLADQAGATPLVPGVTPQVALVRYCLEWDGGTATFEGDDPETTTVVELSYTRPTYNLMKRVRFPRLPYYYVDMNEFDQDFTPDEVVTSDILAMGVISMNVRMYYKGDLLDVWDYGHASGGDAAGLEDGKEWTPSPVNEKVRILGGNSAPQDPPAARTITAVTTVTPDPLVMRISAAFNPPVTVNSPYRIEDTTINANSQPVWIELQSPGSGATGMLPMRVVEYASDLSGTTKEDFRMPYIVEVTLDLTDRKAVSRHVFNERFHIPASEY